MELELTVKAEQRLTPRLIQNMRILQMPVLELSEFLQEQLQENPVLEAERDSDNGLEELEWLSAAPPPYHHRMLEEAETIPDTNRYGSINADTLQDSLHAQIAASGAPNSIKAMADYLAESLDDNGYLTEQPEESAARLGIPETLVFSGLDLLQSLEPAGIGAKNLQDCLFLQLRRSGGSDPVAEAIIDFHMEDMARGFFNKISKCLEVDEASVMNACKRIRALEPYPGGGYSLPGTPIYIYPDIIIENQNEEIAIRIVESSLPRLQISGYYRNLAEQSKDPDVKAYLSEKLNQAKWIIGGVDRRHTFLQACAEAIFRHQKDYLLSQGGALRPYTEKDLAAELGVNISTVSRAIHEKYIQCPRGTFPMRNLFSRAIPDSAVSSDAVRALIRHLIAEEDPKAPLSDQKISELLASRNLHVARRTIAKYRAELGIANTAGRRSAPL